MTVPFCAVPFCEECAPDSFRVWAYFASLPACFCQEMLVRE